jgi:hypothetical protein
MTARHHAAPGAAALRHGAGVRMSLRPRVAAGTLQFTAPKRADHDWRAAMTTEDPRPDDAPPDKTRGDFFAILATAALLVAAIWVVVSLTGGG